MNAPLRNGKTLLIAFIEKRIPLSVIKRFLALGKDVVGTNLTYHSRHQHRQHTTRTTRTTHMFSHWFGADVNVRASLESGESVTPLALAIQKVADAWDEADELISLLLALGADPNLEFTVASLLGTKPVRDDSRLPPFSTLPPPPPSPDRLRLTRVVRLVVTRVQSTPLLQAIKQNNFELVQRLVSAGTLSASPKRNETRNETKP